MITKLRAHITQKCKKLNIRKCRIVPGFCRSGHKWALHFSTLAIKPFNSITKLSSANYVNATL